MRSSTRTSIMALVSVSAIAFSLPVWSAQADTPMETRTRSVAVFKSGLGFFIREGDAKLTDGWGTTDIVPSAALGTFWIGSPRPGVTVERLISSAEERTHTVPAPSIQEILRLNVGKQVSFTLGERHVTGKLVAVPSESETGPAMTPVYPPVRPEYAVIETPTGTLIVPPGDAHGMEFEGSANLDYTVKEKVRRFRFKLDGAKDKAPVTLAYLQKGITWSPAYLVEIVDGSKARITMQGLLINDVEDIDKSTVSFVVGSASFLYADMVTPLASAQSISDFVSRATSARIQGSSGSYLQGASRGDASRVYNEEADIERGSADHFSYSSSASMSGTALEDLFFYEVKDVSLKRGERAYYTVFSAEVPYRHIYEWNVPDSLVSRSSSYGQDSQQPGQPVDRVWHKLRFTNKTQFPWTTAPGMIMTKGQPLSQDTLNYTPKGGEGDLKISVAADIQAGGSEVEKSREADTLIAFRGRYSKVTVDGKLSIRNFKTEPVTVLVSKSISGETLTAGQGGKSIKRSEGLASVNPKTEISWSVELKPNEEKTLDYTYFTYVSY